MSDKGLILTMRFLLFTCVVAVFLVFAGSYAFAANKHDGIAVVVNDSVISALDVDDRVNLVIASSGLPKTPDVQDKVRPQIVDALIDEEIKLQEAARLNIDISQEEIDVGFENLSQQNNMTSEQFRQLLQRGGLNVGTLERQIKAQIAWSKIVQRQIGSNVVVSEFDIDDLQDRLMAGVGKTEYLAAEIVLPVETPEKENEVMVLAHNLIKEMRGGKVRFSQVAQQFSKAPGASQGGDLGWVQGEQLGDDLKEAFINTEKGNISEPVRTDQGYHIILIRDVREVTQDTLPDREQMRSIIGNRRIEVGQRRYLMDLKSAAFIDHREDNNG